MGSVVFDREIKLDVVLSIIEISLQRNILRERDNVVKEIALRLAQASRTRTKFGAKSSIFRWPSNTYYHRILKSNVSTTTRHHGSIFCRRRAPQYPQSLPPRPVPGSDRFRHHQPVPRERPPSSCAFPTCANRSWTSRRCRRRRARRE